jgi:hypothetical protein
LLSITVDDVDRGLSWKLLYHSPSLESAVRRSVTRL